MDFTPIQNIQPITSLEQLNSVNTVKEESSAVQSNPFKSMFVEAIENVKQTDAAKNQAVYDLATGNTDNIHDVIIASTQATLSVDLLVNLRNKALDAYTELMNMNV